MLKALKGIIFAGFIIIMGTSTVFADIIYKNSGSTEGRVESVTDGLILMKENGSVNSYKRVFGKNFYGDYITYKKKPLDKEFVTIPCRVFFADLYNIKIQTPDSLMEIPRYRVKQIELRIE